MLPDKIYRKIAEEFIGDYDDSLFSYKTGNQLVEFFNQYFNTSTEYGPGFPSRWYYVAKKLKELDEEGILNDFFKVILSKDYILTFDEISHSNIEEEIELKRRRLNLILTPYSIDIQLHNNKIFLVYRDRDLKLIDSGGFAEVYEIRGLNRAKKILKYEEKIEQSSRSRFKREYDILESLQDFTHVVKVSNYNPTECSYEMELAESNLKDFIQGNDVNHRKKLWIIRHVVETMSHVHNRDIIHRDISPTNILLINRVIKICDFGIGKELDQYYSHNTMMTKNFGQFDYSPPEQLRGLKNAEKQSDVYSLGKLINFIFNHDPSNYNHELKFICKKSTAQKPSNRYSNAGELLSAIKKFYQDKNDVSRNERIKSKLKKMTIDKEVCEFIINLSEDDLEDFMDQTIYSNRAVIKVIEMEPQFVGEILEKLHSIVYRNFEILFDIYDKYANIAHYTLVQNNFEVEYDEQVLAAEIVNFVAKDVNRFSVQEDLENLLYMSHIDENIKDILRQN